MEKACCFKGRKKNFWIKMLSALLILALAFPCVMDGNYLPACAASKKKITKVIALNGRENAAGKTIKMEIGDSIKLKVKTKSSAAEKNAAFASADKGVATVNKKGTVTAKAPGTARITVAVSGKKTYWVDIKVKNKKSADEIGTLTAGTETYRGFSVDNVLEFKDGTKRLHFNLYLPKKYDGKKAAALYLSLPGYGGYYQFGAGVNLKMEGFAFEAMKYKKNMIIAAPQPDDWGKTSAKQVIGLTRYLLESYQIDPSKVYISGYSGGGETLSLALGMEPELYAAALHVSSQWDGDYEPVVKSRTPVYFAIGEKDSYYGSGPAKEAYQKLYALYEEKGLTEKEIAGLLVLDVKKQGYFDAGGVSDQHGGGALFAYDDSVMGWLFAH